MNFFSWYFGQGLRGYLKIWNNFLWFSLYVFSTKRLLRTLFSPWKRSILPVDWEGFHPILAINRALADTYFRFFGGLIRLFLVFISLFFALWALVIGLLFLLVWLLLPVFLLGSLAGMLFQFDFFIAILILTFLFFASVFYAFKVSRKKDYAEMSLAELSEQKFFKRIIKRANMPDEASNKDFLKNIANLDAYLSSIGLSRKELEKIITLEVLYQKQCENGKKFWTREFLHRIRPFFRYLNFGYTSILNKYAEELTNEDFSSYRDIELINYKEELELTFNAISRNSQNCVLLTGAPGVGRSSIIHYLARLIRRQDAGDFLNYKRIMQLDLLETVSDATESGEDVESFLHNLFREVAFAGNIILVVKNFEKYFNQDDGIMKSLGSIIQEYLPLPSFVMIATSGLNEYHHSIEPHQNIVKNLEVIEVSEPAIEEIIEMIFQRYQWLEEENVLFSYQTVREIINKSDDLGKIMPLPGRAIDLTEKLLNFKKDHPEKELDSQLVSDYIELKTGMPQGKIGDSEKDQLLNLEEALHKRVVGQEEAIKKVADAIRRARTAVHDENKPIGTFLFLGPTGVGKTETAKALAESYYKNESNLIRFDMNEFSSDNSVENLIGSYEKNKQGQLTIKVKDNPFSVVLLDELEKANGKIFDVFLQAFDEGYLTDALGEKISFRGNIIIATSNAGSEVIKEMVEQNKEPEEISERLINHLIENRIFKTEFINRFDAVIFFEPFSDEQLIQVVKLMLMNFSQKLKKEKNIELEYAEGVLDKIINEGYDPIFGARSIRRYLDDKIKNAVSTKLLQNEEKIDNLRITVEDLETQG